MSDLIDRQAAKHELYKMLHDCFWADDEEQDAVAVTLDNLPSVQPEPSEITDEQAILHLQSTGWMQNHDREMYESGLRERLADDSEDYDSLIPCDDAISRQAAIDALGDEPEVWSGNDEYAQGLNNQWHYDVNSLKAVPPVQPEPQWIPCSERLPENRVCVIVCFREWQQYSKRYIYSIVTGWYARKHSVRENVFSEWEGDCDYDEDEDEFYIHEGWYEFTTQGNADLMNWYINAEVVAWMPLPEPYREEGEQE